jgi:GNAT superfamily N-acetyltransferase
MPACSLWSSLTLAPGRLADYAALRPFHYRPGRPGATTRVFVATFDNGRAPPVRAGVLVEAMPALACGARAVALPGRYDRLDPLVAAARLNRELRTIARVVVHPQFRAIGLGVALVRHLLAHAETPYVEALAAMGRAHPLFARAGMRQVDTPPPAAVVRLAAALVRERLTPEHLFALSPDDLSPFLRRELRHFARDKPAGPAAWLAEARTRALSTPLYYLWPP